MMRMNIVIYEVHAPKMKSWFPFASAKRVVFLDERNREPEYTINGEPVDVTEFDDFVNAFFEMPDECTSIKEWEE